MADKQPPKSPPRPPPKPVPKQSSPRMSTLASNILADRIKPTRTQIKSLAADVLGQDQTKGQGAK